MKCYDCNQEIIGKSIKLTRHVGGLTDNCLLCRDCAEKFNLQQHYEIVYDNYCNLADFLAEKLGKKNTDEAMDEFKKWLVKK